LLSFVEHFTPDSDFSKIMSSHEADTAISIITVLIFAAPIISSRFLGFPKRND
jgi:hypothetical protein